MPHQNLSDANCFEQPYGSSKFKRHKAVDSLSAARILLTAPVNILSLSSGIRILVTSANLNGLIFRMRCKE